ncbi:thiol-disulfide oxidoreductase DCC family protein [Thiomicrospira aerophila]|uniref:thiol-disulfide oxidoreductase DCC family protein n=1 Tax=Thiomicrospira aerophila TaxID=92245 RepID=UPI00022C43F5|nr:DUF393 domain-containing protein [Thiomicrospira aerophila]
MAQHQIKGLIRVYYDGLCGLCRREIAYYQKIQPADVFEWIDITQSADDLAQQGISLQTALKHLHVQDAQGHWHLGVDAFLVIWRGLGGVWSMLARIVALPGLLQLARIAYKLFAAWRYKRLSHCKLD